MIINHVWCLCCWLTELSWFLSVTFQTTGNVLACLVTHRGFTTGTNLENESTSVDTTHSEKIKQQQQGKAPVQEMTDHLSWHCEQQLRKFVNTWCTFDCCLSIYFLIALKPRPHHGIRLRLKATTFFSRLLISCTRNRHNFYLNSYFIKVIEGISTSCFRVAFQ